MKATKRHLITAALPYANGPVHIGHLAGVYIPADIYYACLESETFDIDGDDEYGEEIYDNHDQLPYSFFPQIYLGRIPADSAQEVVNFVNKCLTYEKSYFYEDYMQKALSVGEQLYMGGASSFAKTFLEEIRQGSRRHGYKTEGFPMEWQVETLYERDNNWQNEELIEVINKGVHLINHLGHSDNYFNMKLNLRDGDLDLLTNDKYFLGYTQGCYAGAFDNLLHSSSKNDSIIEHLVLDEYGAFAYIANTRYGWGDLYNTN